MGEDGERVEASFILFRTSIGIFWQSSYMLHGLLFANNVCLENL